MGFDRIVAFTATPNLPSQAVMGRLGMTRRPDLDFDHPMVPLGDPLRPHLVWSQDAASQSGDSLLISLGCGRSGA
jgi:RimJ/RimL family protein N-acetyltransferase